MIMQGFLIILVLQFFFVAATFADELVLAQVVFRHGDRSPITVCKSDEYQEDKWPQGFGELSERGIQQTYDLGKRLRKRYVDQLKFVSSGYSSKEIYVRSTDVNRTLMSAASSMAGFYESNGKSFAPVPIHSIQSQLDIEFRPKVRCRTRINSLHWLLIQTPEFNELVDEYKILLWNNSLWCNRPIYIFHDERAISAGILNDAYNIEERNNLTLPGWVTPELRKVFAKIAEVEVEMKNGIGVTNLPNVNFSYELPRIMGAPALWYLIGNMHAKQRCLDQSADESNECLWIEKRKLIVNSAHDTVLSSLLVTLGLHTKLDRPGYPNVAAALLFELWRRPPPPNTTTESKNYTGTMVNLNAADKDDFYVKIIYWPGVGDDPKLPSEIDLSERISGCKYDSTNHCSLTGFMERSKAFSPIDERECDIPINPPSAKSSPKEFSILNGPFKPFSMNKEN